MGRACKSEPLNWSDKILECETGSDLGRTNQKPIRREGKLWDTI